MFEEFRFGCLRRLRKSDVIGMLEWMHDDDIAEVFQYDFRSTTAEDALKFIESSWSDETNLHLAIVDVNDEYMGTISLKHINKKHLSAEYAISTRSRAHGSGLAMEATKDLLRYAFAEIGLHRVYLNVRSTNARARRFYEKCGFRYEGTSKDDLKVGNSFYDLDWFALLSNESSCWNL